MSTTTATPYSERIYKNERGELYFTLVCCPGCELEFRLLWPSSIRNYPNGAALHLECPGCKRAFTSKDLARGKLFHVGCGCEHYPAVPVVL